MRKTQSAPLGMSLQTRKKLNENGQTFASMLVRVLLARKVTTWEDFLRIRIQEGDNQEFLTAFARWVDTHIPFVNAGGMIDPDAIVEAFANAMPPRRLISGYDARADFREPSEAARVMRCHAFWQTVQRSRRVVIESLAELEERVRDSLVLEDDVECTVDILREMGVTPKGSIGTRRFDTVLEARGIDLSAAYGLKLEPILGRLLNRRAREEAEVEVGLEVAPALVEATPQEGVGPAPGHASAPEVEVEPEVVSPELPEILISSTQAAALELFWRVLAILVRDHQWRAEDRLPSSITRQVMSAVFTGYNPGVPQNGLLNKGALGKVGRIGRETVWQILRRKVTISVHMQRTPQVTEAMAQEIVDTVVRPNHFPELRELVVHESLPPAQEVKVEESEKLEVADGLAAQEPPIDETILDEEPPAAAEPESAPARIDQAELRQLVEGIVTEMIGPMVQRVVDAQVAGAVSRELESLLPRLLATAGELKTRKALELQQTREQVERLEAEQAQANGRRDALELLREALRTLLQESD